MAAIQKGHWNKMEEMLLHYNEVSVMGVRSTASSQFHQINYLRFNSEEEFEPREIVEENKSALET